MLLFIHEFIPKKEEFLSTRGRNDIRYLVLSKRAMDRFIAHRQIFLTQSGLVTKLRQMAQPQRPPMLLVTER